MYWTEVVRNILTFRLNVQLLTDNIFIGITSMLVLSTLQIADGQLADNAGWSYGYGSI